MKIEGRERGTLRIYLGAAPGVGKTYAMLAEGHRRLGRGTDLVVGFVETHGRGNTADLVDGLEVVPRRTLVHRGVAFTELDVHAVLARHPEVALVDELAHGTVPGSRNAHRWQDVEELLAAGIDVISTLNVQHLASLTDVVEGITGIRPQETIPDEIVRRADQLELVDMSPEALRRRLMHGNVFDRDEVDAALGNYFRTGNLTALRELALLWLADRVDDALERYREQHEIDAPWPARERVVVGLTGGPQDAVLIRRAARIARQAAGGELLAVHITSDDGLAGASTKLLTEDRTLVESLGGTHHSVLGGDPAAALLEFARGANASQVVIGIGRRSRIRSLLRETVTEAVLRQSGPIDVHLVPYESGGGRVLTAIRRRGGALGARRRGAGWVLALLGPSTLAALMLPRRAELAVSTHAMIFMIITVAVALLGGLWPALAAAVTSGLLLNWFYTPPYSTWSIQDPENAFALGVFVVVAVAVSSAVDLAARRSVQAARSSRESETLSLLASSVLRGEDGVDEVLSRLVETFGMTSATMLERNDEQDGWRLIASAGQPACTGPEEGDESVLLSGGPALVMRGRRLSADDRRVLEAFAAQAAVMLERQRLRVRARQAADLAHGNAVRTALLAAVSHDLRTPLASIKAAASSLRQPDVQFAPEDEAELLATVEDGVDRLEGLIGNLLDVTRLQTGAVRPLVQQIAVDEVVPRALVGLAADRVKLELDEALPMLRTDPGLLERIVANVVQNALTHSDSDLPVLVTASARAGAPGDTIEIRVVDRGRGVPDEAKGRMFAPFQRLGDGGGSAGAGGVGLGLAVARGFAEALGGTLAAQDTPGGGLTMVLVLPMRIAEPGEP